MDDDSQQWPTTPEEWATKVKVMREYELVFRDLPCNRPRRATIDIEPVLLVQRVTRNVLLCGGPSEHFSTLMPVWNPTPAEEGLRPIDILYGVYQPTDRRIEIYVNRIRQDASSFGAKPTELIEIVRIHEYAHAVVHLGVSADYGPEYLSRFGANTVTAWPEFIAERGRWSASATVELHEFLAQAITYATLAAYPEIREQENLRAIFDALEAKQPSHYQLPVDVKGACATADWSLILDAARGVIDGGWGEGHEFVAGVAALICGKQ